MKVKFSRWSPVLTGALLLPAAVLAASDPLLEAIRFEGPLPFSEQKALKVLELDLGTPFDPEETQAASDRLRESWRNRYYPYASVKWEAGPSDAGDGLAATFTSDPGPRGKLLDLRFEGNQALSDAVLANVVQVRPRPSLWDAFTGRDVLILEELAADQAAILALYQSHGYMDAAVGTPQLTPSAEKEGFDLIWPMTSEGAPYTIASVELLIDSIPHEIDESLPVGLAPGDPVSPHAIRSANERLRQHFQNQGFAFAEVDFETKWDAATARAALTYKVESGGKVRLNEVIVQGNQVTGTDTILKELPMQPGETFDLHALQQARQNLEASGLFADLQFDLDGTGRSEEYDLIIHVDERPTRRAEVGMSYDTGMGPAVIARVSDLNFALGPPWRGDAYQAALSATAGPEVLLLEASLSDRRIGSSDWSMTSRLFAEDREYINDDYDQRGAGASLLFTHPTTASSMLTLGLSLQSFEIYNESAALQAILIGDENDLDFFGPVLSWKFDSSDNALRPTTGLRLSQTVQLGLPVAEDWAEVLIYEGRGAYYLNPVLDHVLQFQAGFETVDALNNETVALPLRRFLGGPSNLRGFEFQTLSPYQNGIAVGGESLWWAGVEYSVPVLPRLDVSTYYQLGSVDEAPWAFGDEGPASNWGIGLQLRADNFPIRVDVAFPIELLDGDTQNERGDVVVSFSAGYRF